jgi:hypothetical protein
VSTGRPQINLQDTPFTLKNQSGTTTWAGTKSVQLDATLKIDATLTGVAGAPWSIEITSACPDDAPAAKVFSKSGSIPAGGGQGISKTVKVAADPCAGGKTLETKMGFTFTESEPATMTIEKDDAQPAQKAGAKKSKKGAK